MIKTNIGEMPEEDYESMKLAQYGYESQEQVNADALAELEDERKYKEWQKEQMEKVLSGDTERNNPMGIEEKPENSEKKAYKEIKAENKEERYAEKMQDATDLAGSLELVDNGLDYNDANAVIETIKQQGEVKYKSFITSLLMSGFQRRNQKKTDKLNKKIVKHHYKLRKNKIEISKRNGKINLAKHEVEELKKKCASLERQGGLYSIIGGNKSFMVAKLENINAMKIQKTLAKIDDLSQYIRGQYDEIKVFNDNIVGCYSNIKSCEEQISEVKKSTTDVQLLADQSASSAILHFLVANKLGMEVSELYQSFTQMEQYNKELFGNKVEEEKTEQKQEEPGEVQKEQKQEPTQEPTLNNSVAYLEMSLQEALEVKENGIEYIGVRKVDNRNVIAQLDSLQKEFAECILEDIRDNKVGQTL